MVYLGQNPLWPQAFNIVHQSFLAWWPAENAPKINQWAELNESLKTLGLSQSIRDALIVWAEPHATNWRKFPLKIRLLHPMEKELLSPEAYGYLLELYRLNLIEYPLMEAIIEQCGGLIRLPATREQVQALVHQTLSEEMASQGFGLSH